MPGNEALISPRPRETHPAPSGPDFARQHGVLVYKGGFMDGEELDPDGFTAIARLPGLDVLHGQLVGLTASPLTGLVSASYGRDAIRTRPSSTRPTCR